MLQELEGGERERERERENYEHKLFEDCFHAFGMHKQERDRD